MRTTTLRTLASLAALAALGLPHATVAQTCTNVAARNLFGGSLADALLNPPGQEDNQFFTSQGGYPNIFFLIDSSGSMVRLPPNGPPNSSQGVVPQSDVVGCGLDPEFGGTGASPGIAAGTVLDQVMNRTYHSPCGFTTMDNLPYQGHPVTVPTGVDYADAAKVCPYYTPSDPFKTGVKGYDQDFYVDNNNLSSGAGKPNFFPKDLVFHDSIYGGGNDGWTFTGLYPWESGGSPGSIAQFCASRGATMQNGRTREEICNACLTKKGWYYDGTRSTWNAEFGTVTTANLWYTGNYLSFYPPKFVIARRVVKDVIANQSRIRMALARFGTTGYSFVRDFNPSCQSVFGTGNWEQNRSTYVNDVNALGWGGGTPLATSLFDVGRFYHTPSLPWFGATWESTSKESAGSANQLAVCWSCQTSSVILLTDGVPSDNDGNSLPDKPSSIADSNSGKYAGDTTTGVLNPNATDCPRCYDFSGTDADLNNLTKVAFYLHNYDLRGETAGSCGGTGGTLDGKGMPGKQVLDIYTVGFGTGGLGKANRILSNAAAMGGGLFIPTESADQLRAGIFKVFTEINERSTSFSVATVSTLQTTTGHSVIIPRFDPSRDPHWAGHLFRYELYSEFVNDCVAGGTGDLDCDGACGSVFLQDKDGKFIAEDGNGHFIQTGSLPHCDQVPLCVSQAKPCGAFADPPIAARPWWDAYEALQQQQWRQRAVWTVVDTDVPLGVLDGDDELVRLDPNDTVAAQLRPYLGLGATGGVCTSIARKIELAGDTVTAAAVAGDKLECAKTIIRFVLGADVFNEMGRTPAQGWPPPLPDTTLPASATNRPQQDQLLDRKFKLGDIYHSSPVVVDAPLPADGILCPNGLHNQCMESLWRTPVKADVAGTNPYDLYAKSTLYATRRKMILVGANDGMLHAFNGGHWHAEEDDLVTAGVDESEPPFNGYYDRGDVEGPIELWAFIPPDLLGKLPSLLSGEHQIFVDGTAMVRDVWVDGVPNLITSSPAVEDDLKAPSEFHTVAVVGERRGGTHYFALDVTDAAKTKTENGNAWPAPKFLWVYPQPSDPESLAFGETYTEFLPVPPPIGPVRIKADGNSGLVASADTPTMAVAGVATPVPYHERWVTILPGGFDPQGLRGRGVHMVDVWTGKEVFDFSYPTGVAAAGDPRLALEFPVAATPAMVMWGKGERRPSLSFENDGYFDTATFGDTGGQLWVLRFNTPGEMDTNGRVTNWFGGRTFQMGNGTGSFCNQKGGQPFFFITANTALPNSHVYRVYAGTGDRFNLLDTNGGICGPDNIRACAQKGCAVTLDATKNTFATTGLGSSAQGIAQAACSTASQLNFTTTQNLTGTPPLCGVRADAAISVAACPNATGATGFTKDVTVRCGMDADGDYGCRAGTSVNPTTGVPFQGAPLDLSSANTIWSTYPQSRNWYFSLRVFDDTGNRMVFSTAAQAASYDAARYWLTDNVTSVNPLGWGITWLGGFNLIDGGGNTGGTATATSPGWAIYYRHGPTVTTEGHTYNVNMLDERTSSVSGLYGKVLWNSLQPAISEATAATTGCATSKCTASFRRLSYHYGADAVSGAAVFQDSTGALKRSIVQNTLVPAQGDQPTVFVNQKGQIAVGLTAVNPEKGASNLGMGGAMDPVMGLGVVEVSRELHDCRHFKPAAADGTLTAAERAALATKCKGN